MIRWTTSIDGCRRTRGGAYRRVLVAAVAGTVALTMGDRLMAQQTVATQANGVDARAADKLLARPITITLTRVSLHRALDSIVALTKIPVQYGDALIASYIAPVTVNAVDTPLGVVLERILDGTDLRVVPDGQGELKIVANPTVRADSIPHVGVVTGRVVDSANGRGLGGVTVHVAGTKLSATTTDSGQFVIAGVPGGDRIVLVKHFGYRPAERVVAVANGERTPVRVLMVQVPNVLSGVVTTATGTQRKVEVGNDITSLNVDSIRQVAPITSVTDLLESRVPGLTVLHSSGAPGDPARLRLRGASSISENNDPIVIVDGIRVYAAQSDRRNSNLAGFSASKFATPSPLDQIDPASIATVEVFKGPSASSLYGSDAANGVIVITTKRGSAGPTHWSTNLGAGINYMPGDWPINYYRFGFGQSNAAAADVSQFCAWNDVSCTVDSIVSFQALNDPRYTMFASHGGNQMADLTVSGGVSVLTYSLTGSAAEDVGILKLPAIEQERYEKFYQKPAPRWMLRPNKYTTYGGTGQLTAQPSPTLQVTVNSSLFQSAQQRSSLESGVGQIQGTYLFSDQLGIAPLVTGVFTRVTDQQTSWTNGLSLNWRPVSWLPISATGGLNSITRLDESLLPYGINSSSEGVTDGADTTGSYSLGRGNSLVKTVTANTTLPLARGRLATAVGVNLTSQSTADFSAVTRPLSPGVDRPSTFDPARSSFNQSTLSSSTYGWYMEPRLNVSSRFFAAPGFRLDGGSASGSRGGFLGGGLTGFPKIDLSYIAVDRQGDRPLGGVLSLLRPRVAFGYAGVQPGPADKLRLLSPDCSNCSSLLSAVTLYEPTGGPLTFLNTLGNTKLRPERSSELEGGIDAELWTGRLQLIATQYDKIRHDAIISLPVAMSVYGQANQLVNIGVVRNMGTELSLIAQIFESRAFSWNINTQWSHNTNRVVRLNPGFKSMFLSDGTGIVPGFPLFGRWALPIVAYADVNHDGVIQGGEVQIGDSLVYVGQSDPNYQLTLNTGVVLGGRLSVNASVAYTNGFNQFNAGAGSSGMFAQLPNTPGTSLVTQAAVVASTLHDANARRTDIGLMQTVNTVRFQSLSVSYVLPSSVSRMFRVPRTSMALQGNNLGLHSNYRGKDPNVNAFSVAGVDGEQVQDTGQLPQPRTWWLKFTLGN